MNVFFRTIHLYLSLAAGLVIMTACFTGAVLVFEKELQEAFNPERYYAEPSGNRQSLDYLAEQVKRKVPGAEISSIKVFKDISRTVEVNFTVQPKKEQTAALPLNADKKEKTNPAESVRKTAFVNPFNGKVLELYSYRETFFYSMFALHRWLLGGNDSIGKLIVGVSTFIFLFILITGIILWFPKTKAILKQRLKIKWDGSWKRLNHDFHIVLGFYTAIFLFIFAFTGLAWSFKWFNDGIYKVTNSEILPPPEPPASIYNQVKDPLTFNAAYSAAAKQVRNAEYYNVAFPKDSAGVFTVTLLPQGKPEMATHNYYIDQYSGKVLGSYNYSDKNLGQRVRSAFKPVHTGSIFGVYSKVIAFIVCLLGVTFPVTGVVMWINRLKKSKRIRVKKQIAYQAPVN